MPTIYTQDKSVLPKRKEYDFYPTPIELAKAAINQFYYQIIMYGRKNAMDEQWYWLDTGAGTGVWGEALRSIEDTYQFIYGIEIDKKFPKNSRYTHYEYGDFLEKQFSFSPEVVFGNPPYANILDHFRKAWYVSNRYILWLLKDSFLETEDRYQAIFSRQMDMRPRKIWYSTRRVSYSGDGQSNADVHVICLWDKQWLGETTVDWLNWNYDNRNYRCPSCGKTKTTNSQRVTCRKCKIQMEVVDG